MRLCLWSFIYVLLCVGIFAVRMVFSPMILLSLVICAAGTICLLKVMKMPLIIGQLTLKYRDKCVVLLVLCLVFLTFTGTLIRLIWTSFVVAFICGLHMLFRLTFEHHATHFGMNLYCYLYLVLPLTMHIDREALQRKPVNCMRNWNLEGFLGWTVLLLLKWTLRLIKWTQ